MKENEEVPKENHGIPTIETDRNLFLKRVR